MALNCTRCEYGFINAHQIPDEEWDQLEKADDFHEAVLVWIAANDGHDVSVCDCCGNGESWHGTPGEHNYNPKDPNCEPFPGCF